MLKAVASRYCQVNYTADKYYTITIDTDAEQRLLYAVLRSQGSNSREDRNFMLDNVFKAVLNLVMLIHPDTENRMPTLPPGKML